MIPQYAELVKGLKSQLNAELKAHKAQGPYLNPIYKDNTLPAATITKLFPLRPAGGASPLTPKAQPLPKPTSSTYQALMRRRRNTEMKPALTPQHPRSVSNTLPKSKTKATP